MARGRRGGGGCWVPQRRIVVVAEKPKAAEKIAWAIGSGRPLKCSYGGVPFWVVRVNGSWAVVAPSAGHMFGPYSDRPGYPVFEYEWRPLWEFEEESRYLRRFYEMLRRVMPGAYLYVNACDYDVEGSVIGYMIILNLGDVRRARRMKFSSLAPSELRAAFRRLEPLDVEMVEAGMARHELDWLWGINVSRALMDAVRRASGRRLILSAGRVQSPTLVEAVRRWREINLHVPEPRFSVWVEVEWGRYKFRLTSSGWRPATRGEAARAAEELRRLGLLRVAESARASARVRPPPAFNLGDLQSEASRLYGFSPAKTQKIAEDLYLDALISYPRTNSQKLPPTIDYRGILERLASSGGEYARLARRLLAEAGPQLRPVQGPKDDPAHPAIHPTGQPPRGLDRDHARIYDLVVRRFMAAFAGEAVVERTRVVAVDSRGRRFEASGSRVAVEGWYAYYPYLTPSGPEVPAPPRGARLRVAAAGYRTSYTQPEVKLTKIDLLKWMERVNIGTEGTRARIIETLFKRGYLESRGGRVDATALGEAVASVIESLFPDLATPGLTRRFEEMLEDIRFGRRSRREVVEEAKRTLEALLAGFRERLGEVGESIVMEAGLREPPLRCAACGSPARASVGGVPLCWRHHEAAARLARALPSISRALDSGPAEVLERLASREGRAGSWVRDVARLALRHQGLLAALLSGRVG